MIVLFRGSCSRGGSSVRRSADRSTAFARTRDACARSYAGVVAARRDIHDSAAMAGSAGALSAHATRFVGLSVLSLLTSGIVTVGLDSRRDAAAIRRFPRRDDLSRRAGLEREDQPVLLGIRRRRHVDRDGAAARRRPLGSRPRRVAAARPLADPQAREMTTTPALSVRGLSKNFGALVVAQAIDLDLARGARVALIGPNGAGKTTFVNLLTGFLEPDQGTIALAGESLAGAAPRATGQARPGADASDQHIAARQHGARQCCDRHRGTRRVRMAAAAVRQRMAPLPRRGTAQARGDGWRCCRRQRGFTAPLRRAAPPGNRDRAVAAAAGIAARRAGGRCSVARERR